MTNENLQRIIDLIRTAPADSTIEAVRALGTDRAAHFPPLADTRIERVSVGGIPAEWVVAPEVAPVCTILFLHGGAYISGAAQNYRAFTSRLSAACNARILALDYRLAPEEPFPTAIEDAQAAYTWLREHDDLPLFILGDSAGGGLSLALLHALNIARIPQPRAVLLLSPWVDLTLSGESYTTRAEADPWLSEKMVTVAAEMYLNGANPQSPLISPLFGTFDGLPPLLIMVGGREILLSDSLRLAEKASAAGVSVTLDVWYDMIHVFPIFAPLLPEAQHAIDRIGLFLRYHLKRES